MNGKSISTILTATAIALAGFAYNSTASLSQENTDASITQENQELGIGENNTDAKMTFLCSPDSEPPTTLAYIEGSVNLTPVISWYSEYLTPGSSGKELCQQVAQKLQSQYDRGNQSFFATEKMDNKTSVCLVAGEEEGCNSPSSEELFSVNTDYDATCAMENLSPLECFSMAKTRGGTMSVPDGIYTPTWRPFSFR